MDAEMKNILKIIILLLAAFIMWILGKEQEKFTMGRPER